MKNTYLSILCFFILTSSYSQQGLPFKENKKIFLRGNSILIGNNVLGHHSYKPLMNNSLSNDEVKMKYIDVDNDPSTFNSSQAILNNLNDGAKIAHAALYWYGLYPYKTSDLRESKNKLVHIGKGKRDSIVNSIFFKTPNGNYESLIGEVIFDSNSTKTFQENEPYVCYADITQNLQNLSLRNGAYTVANIKATEGKILGGGSAGWLLYIIYEDENASPKYFTTYNGLVEVSEKSVKINFKDFKSKEDGNFKTCISLAAMEGDRNIKTDQVSIFNNKKREFEFLSTSLRSKKNFFNSSITVADKYFVGRNPNSSNTLGFDLVKMEIPNSSNYLLNDSVTQVSLKFQTKKDRYYLFFAAFETEINKMYLEEKLKEKEVPLVKVDEESEVLITKEEVDIAEQMIGVKENLTIESSSKESNKILEFSEEDSIFEELDILPITVPGLTPGYYLITNVFSIPENSKKWSQLLIEKKYRPKTFVNPINNWDYVYISNNSSIIPVYEQWKQNKDLEFFDKIWVLKINL